MTITVDLSRGGDYALADYALQADVVAPFYRCQCRALAFVLLRRELTRAYFTEAGADKVMLALPEADCRRAAAVVERTVDPGEYVRAMRGGTWQ